MSSPDAPPDPPPADPPPAAAGGDAPVASPAPAAPAAPTTRDAWRVWTKVALHSFGGPAGQIAVMHRVLVEEERWVSERRFLHALNYCMLLPGPEAQQLATYVGWLKHGTWGGLLAGGLFVLPGFLAILALSMVYALWGDAGLVAGLFLGIKPAVLAIVIDAVLRIGRRALRNGLLAGLAAAAFLAIFVGEVPFPWIVFGAGALGWLLSRATPRLLAPPAAAHDADAAADDAAPRPAHTLPSWRRALRVLAVCLALWLLPLLALRLGLGAEHPLVLIGEFFSRAALVTFGGAYAVLAYVAQQAVEVRGWLLPGEMLDGLGMAETTPGPLVMVVQFVGFLGAWRHVPELSPLLAGTLGALITTWVTFVPCFLWIFLGAPWIETLRGHRALNGALTAITAAVVGVILNLAVWFALHTLFARVDELHAGGLRWLVPEPGSLRVLPAVLAVLALVATFKLRWSMLRVLGASALAGLAAGALG